MESKNGLLRLVIRILREWPLMAIGMQRRAVSARETRVLDDAALFEIFRQKKR